MENELKENLLSHKYVLYVDYETLDNIPGKIDGLLEIAKIRNKSLEKDVMFILYDKSYSDDTNHYLYTKIVRNSDGKDCWCAIARDEFIERIKKNVKLASFSLFHELGHFINGDYDSKSIYKNTKELSSARKEAINNGKVLEMETKADEFAVSQVGKSTAINSLDYAINRRKKIDNSKLALIELKLRKKHIINLK